MSVFQDFLVGTRLTSIETFDDHLSLLFEDDNRLDVYNRWDFVKSAEPELGVVTIARYDVFDDLIRVKFNPSGDLRIWIRNEDFSGPEAMIYRGSNGQLIVWP